MSSASATAVLRQPQMLLRTLRTLRTPRTPRMDALCLRRSLFQAAALRQRKPAPPRHLVAPPGHRMPPRASANSHSKTGSGSGAGSDTLSALFAQRRLPLIGAALAAGILGFYVMPLFVAYLSGECGECATDPALSAVPSGLPPISAAAFDASLDMPERIMGIARLRKQLAAAAHGAVLEVAVGTGRNLGYYWWNPTGYAPGTSEIVDSVASYTGIDLSADALDVARRRLRSSLPGGLKLVRKTATLDPEAALPATAVDVYNGRVRLLRADAMQPLPPPPASSPTAPTYDTVVQTFGLCSVENPVALLANMAAAVRPDSGRIILLEHGRGRWSLVNSLLDRYAPSHFSRYGCWWNRDMDDILARATAAVPGLEVVTVRHPGRFQFGTLWWIELRVNSKPGSAAAR